MEIDLSPEDGVNWFDSQPDKQCKVIMDEFIEDNTRTFGKWLIKKYGDDIIIDGKNNFMEDRQWN